jgi:hypothetical protein
MVPHKNEMANKINGSNNKKEAVNPLNKIHQNKEHPENSILN